ncbi:MAG: hypothetical protein ACK4Q5_05780 [Saprospiraceae bacterium]
MESLHTYEEDLIRFIYRDMGADEAVSMADCIDADLETRHAFDQLLLAKLQLPKAQFEPSPRSLQNILQYSQASALETRF